MLRNATFNTLDRAVTAGARLIAATMLARALGPTGYGSFQLALTASILVATLADCGLGIANNYLASRFPDRCPALLGNSCFFISLTGAFVAFVFGIVVKVLQETTFASFPPQYLFLIPLLVVVQAVNISLIGLIYGVDKFREKLFGSLLHYACFLAGSFGLILADSLSPSSALLLWTLALAGTSMYWIIILILENRRMPYISMSEFMIQIRYGWKSYIYNISNMLNFRLDMFFVATLSSPEHLGWYALATSIADFLLYFPKGLSNVILTDTAKQSRNVVTPSHHMIYKVASIVVGGASVFTGVLSPILIPAVFSVDFAPAVVPTVLLLPGAFAMGIGIIAAYHLFGLGMPFRSSMAALISAGVTAALDVLLIPVWGIQGAAVASTTAYTVFLAICLQAVLVQTGESVNRLIIPRPKDLRDILWMLLRGKGDERETQLYEFRDQQDQMD